MDPSSLPFSRRRLLGVLAGGLLLANCPAFPVRAADELADTVDKVKASVVAVGTLQATRRPPAKFQATAFVVAQGRHVITNAHAIPDFLDTQNRETLAVFIGRGQQVESRLATKVATDPEHDLALLEITGAPLPALRLGESRRLREGQDIAFTGFPIGVVLGLFPVTHTGVISAISPVAIPAPAAGQLDATTLKRLKNEPYEVLQLDATAYPGSSGSPLYEPRTGRVIGVVNKVFVQESKETLLEKPSGITYAIPIRYAQALLKRAGLPDN
jgi:S1-C subfamily serine protease